MDIFEFFMNRIVREYKSLPEVAFNSNTSLSMSAQNFIGGGDTHGAKINNEQYIIKLIEELEQIFKNRIHHGQALEHIDLVITALSEVVGDSMATLSVVKKTVAALAEKTQAIRAERLSRDPYYVANHGADTGPVFTNIDWSPLIAYGTGSAIIATVHEKIRIDSTEITDSWLAVLGRFLSPGASKNNVRLKDITLPKEKIDEMVTVINSAIEDVLPDEIRETVRLVTTRKKAIQFVHKAIKTTTGLQYPTDTLLFILKHLSSTRKITEALRSEIVELPPSVLSDMMSNINYLDEVFLLMAYSGTYLREVVLERTLVLSNQMINPDCLTIFTNNSGTLENIAHHISFKFPTGELPARGITGEAILGSVSFITNKVTATAGQKRSRLLRLENQSTKMALTEVLTDYIKEIKDVEATVFTHNNPKSLIPIAATNSIVKNISIEDTLYDLIIKIHYKGTFLETLYKQLGGAYLKLVGESNEITQKDLDTVDMVVLVELVTDYVMDKFIKLL